MKKQALRRSLLTMALAASAVALGAGSSHAYLKGPAPGVPLGPGDTPDYLTTPNWANSPPLRKFVDLLPGVPWQAGAPVLTTYNSQANGYTVDGINGLGQALIVAVPDITSYPGSDYYVIQLDDYFEQMHSDLLNPTKQRGYRQTNNGTDTSACLALPPAEQPACLETLAFSCEAAPDRQACLDAANTVTPPGVTRHLGPIIVAQKDRPVRVTFVNNLPATGSGGELFIPVDTSIMGAGPFTIDYDPVTKAPIVLPDPPLSGNFSENRATLHLHGGITPWISDGTPHQWITPAAETTDYPKGVSAKNVSDMDDPGPGAQTFYWTNQQSARLMFYHDHAWGITRLNVYVGEAAGYMIQDPTEKHLIETGVIPADQIPLILEDKTFVDAATIGNTDPTWQWGSGTTQTIHPGYPDPVTGDLWWPHIYMPAQNPFDVTGIAPMGRWAYGPYFWPPTTGIQFPPVPNTDYYNELCDTTNPAQNADNTLGYTDVRDATGAVVASFCQPPEIPGTPNPSWGAEAFMDTPLVNGTAYPVLNVEPKAYRLRILNAAHDRFYNLQLYQADTDPLNQPNFTDCPTCTANSEVRMVPALDFTAMTPNLADPQWPSIGLNPQPDTWPMDGRPGGAPDWNMVGPEWIQIGTEGGFLPKPVVKQNNPVTWNNDVTTFNAGNVNGGTLILGPAERADVIVDFSAFANQTLILYNDAPAPFPALDPHYDYFTGNGDMTEAGGAAPTLAGLGPNIRTIMQIRVSNGTPAPFTAEQITALNDAFATGNASVGGLPLTASGLPVFAEGQNPIIVGQTAYNGIYNEGTPTDPTSNPTFPGNYPLWGISRIGDNAISYEDVAGLPHVGQPLEPKAIQDEMGEVFDDYGRMSAKLGLEMAFTTAGVQTFVLQNFVDPATEVLNPNEVQIWKITHNGVDTHPLHFHLYDVQILNRVGWDGFIRLPDPTELGWKDTIKVSPLEDTIVALRPITPLLPFGVPESIRPLNPMEPLNSTMGFTTIDPLTGQARNPAVTNQMTNFDWEYVVHCHILSHEESDMMRTQIYLFQEALPPYVPGLIVTPSGPDNVLTWTDPTPATDLATQGNAANEIGFIIEISVNNGPFGTPVYVPANRTTYTDVGALPGSRYRVIAYNALGESPITDSLGLFRAATWFKDMNGNGLYDAGVDTTNVFGVSTDVPVAGDWDGDGKTEFGLYRRGTWYLDLNGSGAWNGTPTDAQINGFGTSTDIPLVGDWNGDGISDVGYFSPATNDFYLDSNGNGVWDAGVDRQTVLGQTGDKPVIGDWTGDGIDKIGVFRPSNRAWLLDANNDGLFNAGDLLRGPFGQSTDVPVVGDWAGTGIDQIGVFRSGMWYLDSNNNGVFNAGVDLQKGTFGKAGDKPVVGKW